MSLEPGTMFGQIRVEELLGMGGMSEVYRGYHLVLDRPVALKVIRERRRLSALAKARFLREAKILSRLDHPGVCRVHDLILGEDQDVMVLEYVAGRTLRKALIAGMDEDLALHVGRSISEVLVVAHAAGVVHRDLKPENVMLTENNTVKILDFDLARPVDGIESDYISLLEAAQHEVLERGNHGHDEETETRLGAIVGTVLYMSPEQALGDSLTVAADLYSVGILLHEMLAGELPYPGKLNINSRLLQVSQGRTLLLEHRDPQLVSLVEKLKSLDAEARPSAQEVVNTIDQVSRRSRRGGRRWIGKVLDRVRRSQADGVSVNDEADGL